MRLFFFLILLSLSILLNAFPPSNSSSFEAIAEPQTSAAKDYYGWSAKRLKKEIAVVRKRIKKFKKKAANAATHNLILAAEYLAKVDKQKELLGTLRYLYAHAIRFGNCPVGRTKLRVTFINESKYSLSGTAYTKTNFVDSFSIAPKSTKKFTRRITDFEFIYGLYTGTFYLTAKINGQNVLWSNNFSKSSWPRKKRPCLIKKRWKVTNKDFPAPKLKYAVYGLEFGKYTYDGMYIGSKAHLEGKNPCDFDGGGNNCTDQIGYYALGSEYNTIEEARQDFCRGVAQKGDWNGSCTRWFLFRDGHKHWGCHATVNTAVNNHCPKFNQAGTIFGTIVK